MKSHLKATLASAIIGFSSIFSTFAQEAPAAAAPAAAAPAAAPAAAAGTVVNNAKEPEAHGSSFIDVVTHSGSFGVALWLVLLFASVISMALIVDSFITVKQSKIIPEILVSKTREAMEQGDVVKALSNCEATPGPFANILAAGFGNVQEGFEVIQDSIAIAADLEAEKLLQRINYLSVLGNLCPMLGLIGTVHGMIMAFEQLTAAGSAAAGMLALSISQALWATAVGLSVSVIATSFFYYFKNRATNIILTMEMMTLDQIKVLRNVEVVSE